MEQLELPGVLATPLRPRAKCKPIIKWAGGKAWLVPYLAPGVYQYLSRTGGRYVEPFLGGGALALNLGLPGMILGDACAPLISMYDAVRKYPSQVLWALSALATKGVDEKAYYQVRESRPTAPVVAAARFIYLNKTGYNGLYRENRRGEFNVPYGDQAHRKSVEDRKDGSAVEALFPSGGKLSACAAALRDADLAACDFADTIACAGEGDCVYADPPYQGTFASYTAGGFSDEDQRRLAASLKAAHERGAIVVATNSDLPEVRDLYSWANVMSTAEQRAISMDGANRHRAQTLLITTEQKLLGT